MATKSGNMEQERNFFGRSQDDQNNITGGMGSESVEKYSLGAFVLSVDARIMQVGRQNDISFGSVDKPSDSEVNESDESGPVLTEYWRPTGKLSVGRSRSGFPDCKYDHLVQLLVSKNKDTREALDITNNYKINMTVTYNGTNDGSFQMPDYQCKRLKTQTRCGVKRSMVGVVGFLFRFHEPNTKYKIIFTLLTAPSKRGGKRNVTRESDACKKLSEISIMLETGEKSKWRSVKPSEKTEVRKIPPLFALEPASLSKTSAELVERSVSVVNQLQSLRNDGKWDDFDKLSSDLLLKWSDIDSQIIIKLEQSVGALYRKDFEGSLKFIDESFELIPHAINVPFLAGRGYGYRAGVARRQKNLGEAVSLLHLAEQNNRACPINLDTSNIAYEKASVLLDFIGLSPQKSLKQVREALGNLEKCIDVCMKMEIEDNDLSRFAFIKIAMLLLDCRTDASRERVLSDEFIKKSQECLIRLQEAKYWSEIAEGAKVQFYLASSDLEYRRGNFVEAESFACLARDMAEDLGFTTEISLAQERLDHSRVIAIGGRTGNDFRPFTSSFVSASEGENGDVSSSGSESDWLKSLE